MIVSPEIKPAAASLAKMNVRDRTRAVIKAANFGWL
jgi:hypothetical protein